MNTSTGDRESGFYDETRNLGLDQRALLHEGGYTPQDGEAGILRLLAARDPDEWPTATIAINDLVALGAMRQLARMGVRIPEDIAIIGCDNQFFTPYTAPPLTTLDLRTTQNTQLAIRYLLDPPVLGTKPIVHSVETELIVRESCGVKLGRR